MWAWDSWKADVATADFNPELAKNNMRALFDYQICQTAHAANGGLEFRSFQLPPSPPRALS
jgi:hypothetical protein